MYVSTKIQCKYTMISKKNIRNKYKSLYKNNIIVVIKNITFIFRGYIFLKIEKMFFLF